MTAKEITLVITERRICGRTGFELDLSGSATGDVAAGPGVPSLEQLGMIAVNAVRAELARTANDGTITCVDLMQPTPVTGGRLQ